MRTAKKTDGFAERVQSSYAPDRSQPTVPVRRERIKLAEGGRIVIPAFMREELGVKPGDELLAHVENGELHVRSWLGNLRRVQSELSGLKKPGESIVDEFLGERMAEQGRSDDRLERLHTEGAVATKPSE